MLTWLDWTATTGGDENLEMVREWLKAEFPDIYGSPIGWRMWPSATGRLERWAEVFMGSRRSAKSLLTAVLSAIWATNRAHWNLTCKQNIETIHVEGDAGLLMSVNNNIREGRRQHARAQSQLDTLINTHIERLDQRAEAWHARYRS